MVTFRTRVSTIDENQIIGAEVIVYSDEGDRLGIISIADAETLQSMQDALDSIDETYIQADGLETILTNSEEETTINATNLSGFVSSDFVKTSDLISTLAGYSQTGHTHTIASIQGGSVTQISANKSNASVGENVTITVTLKKANGTAYTGGTVEAYLDGTSLGSKTTNSQGEATYSYTVAKTGLLTFTCNGQNVQVFVKEPHTTESPSAITTRITNGGTIFHKVGNVVFVNFRVSGSGTSGAFPSNTSYYEIFSSTLPESFRPMEDLNVSIHNSGTADRWGTLNINTEGEIKLALHENGAFYFYTYFSYLTY